jgi:hypothetical protein
MPILYGAVAYRTDLTPELQQEMNAWELRSPGSTLIECPNCDVQYGLIVEINASQAARHAYASDLRRIIGQKCPAHCHRIKIN